MTPSKTKPSRGILLLNVGTPSAPDPQSVRAYLREFLMDPYVLDSNLPSWLAYIVRWTLVNGVILRKRPDVSARAYQKVWTDKGSPLLMHHLDLGKKVATALGDTWQVESAMRYGRPSVKEALQKFNQNSVSTITVFPLYPQYSLAATESGIQWVRKTIAQTGLLDTLDIVHTVPPFFDHPSFISSFANRVKHVLDDFSPDHLLFSFHGLPERQVKKTDSSGNYCLKNPNCCTETIENRETPAVEAETGRPERKGAKTPCFCYRRQCFATAQLIANRLGLPPNRYTVSFQSRLGRTPWIRPFTDELYQQLPKRGIRRLAVACPSFVADCLETLEEVAIRGRIDFLRAGGEDLKLVPSLNSSDDWVTAVCEIGQQSKG